MTLHARILARVLAPLSTCLAIVLLATVPSALAAPHQRPVRARPSRLAPRDLRAVVKKWHEPTPGRSAPRDANDRPMLVLVSINTGERIEIAASTDDGGFDARALELASHLLRDDRANLEMPFEPTSLDLVYRAQRHFDAQEIRVVSGYRASRGTVKNIHAKARAIDLVVPGADDESVAVWARAQGFAGVGVYPRSGYCHLDTRPDGYSWVDTSGPGQRNREYPVHRDAARQGDRDARKAGKKPVAPFALPARSVGAIWSPSASAKSAEEDTHEHEESGDSSDE